MSIVVRLHPVSPVDRDVAALRALAHPVRLEMMRQIAQRPETCACDFTKVFAISQPTVSQHLKVLRDAELVRTQRRGNQICYSINPVAISHLDHVVHTIAVDVALIEQTGS